MSPKKNSEVQGVIHTISILVADKPGVLVRVATTFARRGFNIDSLVVSASHKSGFSRMTLVTNQTGQGIAVEQIVKQLAKLIDVVHVYDYEGMNVVNRELALVKVHCSEKIRHSVMEVANIFRANPVDIGTKSIVFEITGNSQKLNAFEAMMDEYGITEMMRTGRLILSRGPEST